MAPKPLKPQLNQIRLWVRQGRTDAWIAHQLDVPATEIASFKAEHELEPATDVVAPSDDFGPAPTPDDEIDLRGADEASIAGEIEAELAARAEAEAAELAARQAAPNGDEAGAGGDASPAGARKRSRRGGRGRGRGRPGVFEATFDHGEEGYGLWLDGAVADDAVYAEYWAGHRPILVDVGRDRIVITRSSGADESDDGPLAESDGGAE